MGCNETSPAHPQGCSGRKKNEPVACATEIQSAPAQGFSFHWSQPSGCQGSIPIPPVRRMKGTKVLGHGKGWAYTHQSLDGDWLTLGDGSAFCQWAVQGTVQATVDERKTAHKKNGSICEKKETAQGLEATAHVAPTPGWQNQKCQRRRRGEPKAMAMGAGPWRRELVRTWGGRVESMTFSNTWCLRKLERKRGPQEVSKGCKLDRKIKPYNHQKVNVLSEAQLKMWVAL